MLFLETERLILRYFQPEDVRRLYEYRSKPEVERFQSWKNYQLEDAKQAVSYYQNRLFYGQGGTFQLAICLKSGEMIGDVFFDQTEAGCFIGYTLDSSYWKQGYAYEVMSHLLGCLHDDYHIHFFRAVILPENQASIRLIRKLGFFQHSRHEYFLYWLA